LDPRRDRRALSGRSGLLEQQREHDGEPDSVEKRLEGGLIGFEIAAARAAHAEQPAGEYRVTIRFPYTE